MMLSPHQADAARVHALVFSSSVYDKSQHRLRGRSIGYIEPPLETIHARKQFVKEAALSALHSSAEPEGRHH